MSAEKTGCGVIWGIMRKGREKEEVGREGPRKDEQVTGEERVEEEGREAGAPASVTACLRGLCKSSSEIRGLSLFPGKAGQTLPFIGIFWSLPGASAAFTQQPPERKWDN